MRLLVTVTAVGLLTAVPAGAVGDRLDWPLRPRPAVVRAFDPPAPNWNRGHRGVDLAAATGQTVYAAASGTVVFAGELAGRPLVSIAHPGGLRTTYEPVDAVVRAGQLVDAGSAVGAVAPVIPGVVPRPACTGVRCGVRRRVPTTSTRWASSSPLPFGSSPWVGLVVYRS